MSGEIIAGFIFCVNSAWWNVQCRLQHGFQEKDEGEADWKVAFTRQLKKVEEQGREEKGNENKIK